MPASRESQRIVEMYRSMFICRKSEDRLIELYRQSIVKGTVTSGIGNEAAIVGTIFALNTEIDVCNLMQRDFAGYIAWGVPLYHLFSHYMANEDSSTQGKDGNVHHGLPEKGLLPMVSHLGAMLPNVVGAVYARRQLGSDSIGVAIIGDGGTSTGDFHEALNIASVLKVPVLFLIENNHWAYSTPNEMEFNCDDLSKRAAGYGIQGSRIKATDAALVYETVSEIVSQTRASGEPYLLQADTYRLAGHAAYDTGDYVPQEELNRWKKEDPIDLLRARILTDGIKSEEELDAHEAEWIEYVSGEANRALKTAKITADTIDWAPYSQKSGRQNLPPFSMEDATPVQAVNAAMDHALSQDSDVFIVGEDIGHFGGPFKTTKGLYEKYGRDRIIDMPLAESGFSGFAVGAAEMGMRPIVEMQFSDFSTDAVTQIGVNGGTYFFRTGLPLPLTIRMPSGGGLSYGPFHSEDLEGLFGTFPGLKLVYPSFPADFFNLLLASIYDDNPVLFFESKFLHRRLKGNIQFDGTIPKLDHGRIVRSGEDATIFSYGAMLHEAISAADEAEKKLGIQVEIIDPLVLKPFDIELVAESVRKTHRFLLVHESWAACGVGAWIISKLIEQVFFDLDAPPLLYTAPDVPVPFAPELESRYRPDAEGIFKKIEQLMDY